MKVSVLGAGNGGFALAFHLVQMGHEVLLFELEKFKKALETVEQTGKIIAEKEIDGKEAAISGTSSITKTTTSIKEAIEFGEYIMLIVPAYGQGPMFEMALPYLTDKHVFISLPGNNAILEYAEIVRKNTKGLDPNATLEKIEMPCTFAESSSIPYACRRLDGNRVFIGGIKKQMEIGVYPCSKTNEVVDAIQPLYGLKLVRTSNVLEASFYNLNVIMHPPITLFNAGRIEATKGNFWFYLEGVTPAIARVMEGLDQERCALAKSMGIELRSLLSVWKAWYGDTTSTNIVEFTKNAKQYQNIKAPNSLEHRYLTEDLVYILSPWVHDLGPAAKVETPLSRAIITSAEALSGLSLKAARGFNILLNGLDSLENIKSRL